MFDHMGVVDPDVIIAAWLHDVPEDSLELQQPKIDPNTKKAPKRYSVWARETERWLSRQVGARAARLTMLMTRPQPDGIEIKNPDDAEKLYHSNLEKDAQAILIKMPDRLHNIRTLEIMPPENQIATLISTLKDYSPIFATLAKKYPKAYKYYKTEEEKALRPIAEKFGIDYDSLVASARVPDRAGWRSILRPSKY